MKTVLTHCFSSLIRLISRKTKCSARGIFPHFRFALVFATAGLILLTGLSTQATAQQNAGDRANSIPSVPGIIISETLCPVVDTITLAADGVEMPMSYRKPSGEGPFPAIVFFHGGGGQAPSNLMTRSVKYNATPTRFLEKGFVVAAVTRRRATSKESGPDLGGGLLLDGLASVEFVKQLPFVDSGSVVIFGGSMGGALGLLVAGKTQLATLVTGEPASMVWTRILLKTDSVNKLDISQNTKEQSTMSVLQRSRDVLGKNVLEKVTCPVLILMGDSQTGLNIHNKTITIPEFKSLGKEVTVIEYPGLAHGFYWGSSKPPNSVTVEELDKVVNDAGTFLGIFVCNQYPLNKHYLSFTLINKPVINYSNPLS